MEIFDITKAIFESETNYKEVTNVEKSKNFFMINRMFARKYPQQANILQHIKINSISVVDFWQQFLSKQYNKTPYWMFIKGIKKTQEVKEKKQTISNDIIKEYCKSYKIDRKTVDDALLFFNEEIVKELKIFEKTIKEK